MNTFGCRELGQFETPNWVASLLWEFMPRKSRSVLDLGTGRGALLRSMPPTDARVVGVDIVNCLNGERPSNRFEFVRTNVLGSQLRLSLPQQRAFDTVVSNPPYSYVASSAHLKRAIKESFGNKIAPKQRVRSELVFLLHAFLRVLESGQIAFIVPTTMMSSLTKADEAKSEPALARLLNLTTVIKLPRSAFDGTEVETCIAYFDLAAKRTSRHLVRLHVADESGQINRSSSPRLEEFAAALTASGQLRDRTAHRPTLRELGAAVTRGRQSRAQLSRSGMSYFHTSSFVDARDGCIAFDRYSMTRTCGPDVAQAGDILMARVGSRCIGRSALVVSGRKIVTDCVHKITLPEQHRRQVWEFLKSERGVDWQHQLSRGACATFIPAESLLTTPIPLQS
jgi:hypothetical protein